MALDLDQQLWQAARQGNLVIVQIILTAGVDINTRDQFGNTALNLAAEAGHVEIVRYLLDSGADIENLGGAQKTPLMNATFAGHTQVVELLLQHQARINRDLIGSLQLKVNILHENAELGMVYPAGAQAWQNFLDYMVQQWEKQIAQQKLARPEP